MACELHERGVADEGAGNHTGDGEAECPADEGNESGSGGGKPEYAHHAMGHPVAVVVTGDGLEALAYSEDDATEHGGVGDEYAGRGDGLIAAIVFQRVVDEDVYKAGGDVDYRGGRADTYYSPDQRPGYAVGAGGEDDRAVFPGTEMTHNEYHGDGHRDVGRYGRTLDSKPEEVNEGRREEHIEPEADEHRQHGAGWKSGRAHHIVEGEGQVGHQQPGEDEHHKVAGIGKGLLIRSEQPQHGGHEDGEESYVDDSDGEGQHQGVAENAACPVDVAGSEEETHTGCRTGSDQHPEGGGDIHHREGDGQSGDGLGPHDLADDDSVDDVVKLHDKHPDHRREGVFPEESAYRHLGEFTQFTGILSCIGGM